MREPVETLMAFPKVEAEILVAALCPSTPGAVLAE